MTKAGSGLVLADAEALDDFPDEAPVAARRGFLFAVGALDKVLMSESGAPGLELVASGADPSVLMAEYVIATRLFAMVTSLLLFGSTFM